MANAKALCIIIKSYHVLLFLQEIESFDRVVWSFKILTLRFKFVWFSQLLRVQFDVRIKLLSLKIPLDSRFDETKLQCLFACVGRERQTLIDGGFQASQENHRSSGAKFRLVDSVISRNKCFRTNDRNNFRRRKKWIIEWEQKRSTNTCDSDTWLLSGFSGYIVIYICP